MPPSARTIAAEVALAKLISWGHKISAIKAQVVSDPSLAESLQVKFAKTNADLDSLYIAAGCNNVSSHLIPAPIEPISATNAYLELPYIPQALRSSSTNAIQTSQIEESASEPPAYVGILRPRRVKAKRPLSSEENQLQATKRAKIGQDEPEIRYRIMLSPETDDMETYGYDPNDYGTNVLVMEHRENHERRISDKGQPFHIFVTRKRLMRKSLVFAAVLNGKRMKTIRGNDDSIVWCPVRSTACPKQQKEPAACVYIDGLMKSKYLVPDTLKEDMKLGFTQKDLWVGVRTFLLWVRRGHVQIRFEHTEQAAAMYVANILGTVDEYRDMLIAGFNSEENCDRLREVREKYL